MLLIGVIFSFSVLNFFYTRDISYEVLSVWVFHILILIAFNTTYLVFYAKSVGKLYLQLSPSGYALEYLLGGSQRLVLEILTIFT